MMSLSGQINIFNKSNKIDIYRIKKPINKLKFFRRNMQQSEYQDITITNFFRDKDAPTIATAL